MVSLMKLTESTRISYCLCRLQQSIMRIRLIMMEVLPDARHRKMPTRPLYLPMKITRGRHNT